MCVDRPKGNSPVRLIGSCNERTQDLASRRSSSGLCHDVDDEETNGRRACSAIADSGGVDAGGIAVQHD